MGHKVYITRRLMFSAAHRLHIDELSDEENKNLYGKCNHVNGHGHNYVVKVTLIGDVDKQNGMVYNLTDLKAIMKDVIENQMDHKCIDKDVEYFKHHASTAENLSIYIWEEIEKRLTGAKLHKVKVVETENNTAVYKGEKS